MAITIETLLNLVESTQQNPPIRLVAQYLQVTPQTVYKRAKKYNIDLKEPMTKEVIEQLGTALTVKGTRKSAIDHVRDQRDAAQDKVVELQDALTHVRHELEEEKARHIAAEREQAQAHDQKRDELAANFTETLAAQSTELTQQFTETVAKQQATIDELNQQLEKAEQRRALDVAKANKERFDAQAAAERMKKQLADAKSQLAAQKLQAAYRDAEQLKEHQAVETRLIDTFNHTIESQSELLMALLQGLSTLEAAHNSAHGEAEAEKQRYGKADMRSVRARYNY